MGRIISIDYGTKRSGIAVTDPLQIIVSPLRSISTPKLLEYLEEYLSEEKADKLVIGYPTHKDGNKTYLCGPIDSFLKDFSVKYPQIKTIKVEESFSSVDASKLLAEAVKSKKKRQEKGQLDMYSAVVILRRFLRY